MLLYCCHEHTDWYVGTLDLICIKASCKENKSYKNIIYMNKHTGSWSRPLINTLDSTVQLFSNLKLHFHSHTCILSLICGSPKIFVCIKYIYTYIYIHIYITNVYSRMKFQLSHILFYYINQLYKVKYVYCSGITLPPFISSCCREFKICSRCFFSIDRLDTCQ